MKRPVQRFEDTAANWAAANPILPRNWEAVESDTGRSKRGDDVTRYTALAYNDPAGTSQVFDVRDYGALGGTVDDTAAVQGAVDALVANNGGTLLFPEGITKIEGVITADFNTKAGHLKITGEAGATIHVASTGANGVFYIINNPLVTVTNLDFVGTGSTGNDMTQSLFWFNVCEVSIVEKCRFIGLGVTAPVDATFAANKWYGIIVGRQTRLTVNECLFGGCASVECPNIGVDDWHALAIRDTQFVDYGYFGSETRSKTGWGTNSYWIRAINAAEPTDGFRADTLILENILCDEGNIQAIYIDDIGSAQLRSVHCNSGNLPGPTIYFKDAQHVTLDDCSVHQVNYSGTDGVGVENCDAVDVNRLLLEGIVTNFNILGTTKRVNVRNSTGVTFVNTAGAFIDADQAMPATASAAALAPKGRVTHVTGTTNITSITATNFKAGDELVLIFDGVLTVTDGNNLKLAGNFVTTADDVLRLIYDGTNFYEMARSVN